MLYGADIWCVGLLERGKGEKDGGWGARGFSKKMKRVQRLSALMITGGMRSTATDLLNAHADLLPIQLQIRKHCHRETLHMARFHESHPSQKELQSASRGRKGFRSPLHRLFLAFKINPKTTETIESVRHNTKWIPEVTTRIARDKDEAVLEDMLAEEEDYVSLYSD
ncbi:hypothetical protein HYDPIDRAFT_104102 [Hydnomerulius pinastri MD-312]|uniref:Uncharacterized protein n=1 Tax=Hydnomerulius pinastri MD-312 TaxID=994086 RepID=A0A0C2PGC5_9AGAM|nr:hypothetical protein HYDPIDRAFT_104102 [Hydnomerulius pinastri MD-312]